MFDVPPGWVHVCCSFRVGTCLMFLQDGRLEITVPVGWALNTNN